MKLPRDLKGSTLARMLCKEFGYRQVHQQGSHLILETEQPIHQRLSIPNHPSLRLGTLNSILNAVAKAKRISKDKLIEKLSAF